MSHSASHIKPPTQGAVALAKRLDETFFSLGLDEFTVSVTNGCKVDVSWKIGAETAFKVDLYILEMVGGYILGQLKINTSVTSHNKYWKLLDALTASGFRHGLAKPDQREHFFLDIFNESGPSQLRIDVINIKTDAIVNPRSKFIQFVELICKFEGIELSPPAPTTVSLRRNENPLLKAEAIDNANTRRSLPPPPPPASAEWVPLPSSQGFVPQVSRILQGLPLDSTPPQQMPPTTQVDVEKEIEVLRKKLADLELMKQRMKRIADFEEHQRAERLAFEMSLKAE
jgi:hypothetical protein